MLPTRTRCVIFGALLLFVLPVPELLKASPGPDLLVAETSRDGRPYALRHVEGNLYRFTAGKYHSVFLVTERGIVVTDPIDRQAATWLKQQLTEEFSQPIRYVIYSHSHPDHTYGGEVFADSGVTFVSHRRARRNLRRTKAQTKLPDLVFEDELTLHLGDHTIKLRYHGPNNGRGSISMMFEPVDTLFVVDWIVLGRLPYKDLPGYDLEGMIDSTRAVLDLEFDTFVGGHGEIGTKRDVRRYRSYLETLYAEVLEGIRSGKSLAEVKRDADLEAFSDLRMFDAWRELNIEAAWRTLRDDSYLFMRPDVPSPEVNGDTRTD